MASGSGAIAPRLVDHASARFRALCVGAGLSDEADSFTRTLAERPLDGADRGTLTASSLRS